MSGPSQDAGWDAVRIADADDVAVALRDISGRVRVRCGDAIVDMVLPAPIPFGHKLALADLPAGHEVRKYGAPIGRLTCVVRRGEHVHIHNLKSRRADRLRTSLATCAVATGRAWNWPAFTEWASPFHPPVSAASA